MDCLKRLRNERGLLQKDVAEALRIDRTTYVKYENGTSHPDHEMLKRIASYYGVTIDYLLDNVPQKETPDSLDETLVNLLMQFPADRAKQLIDIASLPQDQFQRVLDFVAGMKSNDTD